MKISDSVEKFHPLPQLDGNLSILSESEISECCDTLSDVSQDSVYDSSDDDLPIPVIQTCEQGVYCDPPVWYEQYIPTIRQNTAKVNNITIKSLSEQDYNLKAEKESED